MTETTANPVLAQTRIGRLLKYGLQAIVLLPAIAGFFAYRLWIAQPTAPVQPMPQAVTQAAASPAISAKTFEDRFGIRITLIAVTAGGGIVDFRYKIIDKKKAEFLLGDAHSMPSLMAERSGITLLPPNHVMKHNTQLENGRSYFQFYANTQNAVKPGDFVAVVIGSLRLEPIIAQ
ncbi:MAG: hypothetical protein NT075_01090 [Chloroflexi bacterium]|nr:hypothetical protein [Chloroflexota bacterium]